MSLETNSFGFGEFLLDVREKVLLRDGKPLAITPKAFQLLQILVENHGHLIERNELLNTIWSNSFVEEGNLSFTIRLLRKALDDSKQNPRFIETVTKRGYRFVAEVRQIENNGKKIDAFELIESKSFSTPVKERLDSETPPSGAAVGLADWRQEVFDEELIEPEIENLLPRIPKDKTVQPIPSVKTYRNYVLVGLLGIVMPLILGYGLYDYFKGKNSSAFRVANLTRLTSNGKTKLAAVSPDGKFVSYILEDEGSQSIWLKNTATGSDVQILPPAEETSLSDLTFSPDGNYVYYNAKKTLYQLPVLGGLPKIVLQNFGVSLRTNSITFSPDSKKFAFVRHSLEGEETASLIIANADGTNERVLVTSKRPELFLGSAAWSPDGRVIAVASSLPSAKNKVVTIRIADGVVSSIPSPEWSIISQVVWQPDGKGLLVVATQGRSSISHQIWSLSYPGGEAKNISSDLNNYQNVSLTSDGRSLIAVRMEQTSHIWVTADVDSSHAKQLTQGIDRYDGIFGLSFLSNGKIIYESTLNGEGEVWIMDMDGYNAKKLLDESGSNTVSPDGKYLIFQSNDGQGVGLFRLNLSNGEKKRLTTGADVWATVSPDNKWVIFTRWADQVALWKVSIDGGDTIKLTNVSDYPLSPAISPDEKFIAFNLRKNDRKLPPEIVIIPFDGGEIIKKFPIPIQYQQGFGKNALQWTPDGQAIRYSVRQNEVSNIWEQPINGNPPIQVTNFGDKSIFNFSYSPDAKQLALSRGIFNRDVILIKIEE